mmetsp:Transcript_15343/g.33142  ORF Transcript_15343/g.33142 Transcript_15343/m.33142 type:complete len:302 (+) Transcript_15343:1551-2456(+)
MRHSSGLNFAIFFTREGSFRVRLDSSSPASMMLPGATLWLILPPSVVRRGITIFIASTSMYGTPFSTSAPSSCRKRTTLPLTSLRSSLGSNWVGISTTLPSSSRRMPRGSSCAERRWVRPPKVARRVPSDCSRRRTTVTLSPRRISTRSAASFFAVSTYLVDSYTSSTSHLRALERVARLGSWPLERASWRAVSSSPKRVCARQRAAESTMSCGSVVPLSCLAAMILSSQLVSMVFSMNSGVPSSCSRYSTAVRISPRTSSSLRASTSALRASSRVSPEANRWPNCESANSCTAPLVPTEK